MAIAQNFPAPLSMDSNAISLTDREFKQFQQLIYDCAGISLSEVKRSLVSGRLLKRLRHYEMASFSHYLKLLTSNSSEMQVMVDLLTTNETYFFREQAHFDYLTQIILPQYDKSYPVEIWSAACSTGEEVYTLAMVLAETRGESGDWSITGTDINSQVLEKAQGGHYPMSHTRGLPTNYLKAYCLKGVRSLANTFMIAPELRAHTKFFQLNLNTTLPDFGLFDVIFLRNVMIYFDIETKRQVVARLVKKLKPGGYFIVGHAETLHGISGPLRQLKPTIYQLPK